MFGSGKTFDSNTDIPDLSDKVILVTGGNNGLGKESCLKLAKQKAHIILAARTPSKAESAIAEIKQEVPDANIAFLELDLASLESVKRAADEFNASGSRLDVLMNNAGIMALPAGTTKDGYELQFGTNHIGHALLTKLLMPTLQRTAKQPNADVRIVNLSSGGHKMPPKGGLVLNDVTTDMQSYNTWVRYGQSKLANILFTRELARRYPTIKSIALHPGPINTGLPLGFMQAHPWLAIAFHPLKTIVFKSVQYGALTQLFAASSKDVKSGQYYVPVAQEDPGSPYSQDSKLSAELWEWTEAELAKHGY